MRGEIEALRRVVGVDQATASATTAAVPAGVVVPAQGGETDEERERKRARVGES
jgi:hypothetical protein